MPRQRNHLPTETFTVSTTPHVIAELQRLVKTGHFGKTHAEAAERIIAAYLHETFGVAKLAPSKRRNQRTART